MTAAVASYNVHERFFGNDLSNFDNFKTVERKSKVVSTPVPKKSAPVLKKHESPRASPVMRRKSPPAKAVCVQDLPKTSALPVTPAPIKKYSKDLLLSLRENATTSVEFIQSLNMPPPATPKPKAENRAELSRSSSDGSSPLSAQRSASKREKEEDEHRLAQRQKQLEFGKNTPGYLAYVAQVPRDQRSSSHPRTPEKSQKCSKRSWDGQVRKWRRQLHLFDPSGSDAPLDSGSASDSDDSVNQSQSTEAAASSPIRTSAVQLGASIHAILASSGSPQRAEPGDAI